MTAAKEHRVKLDGPGMNLDRTVSPEIAKRVMLLVLSEGTAGGEPGDLVQGGTGRQEGASGGLPPLSIREFLTKQGAKTVPEHIATIASYLRSHRAAPVFTKKDLIKGFEDAQESVPKNLPRDLAKTVKIGWIAPKTGQSDSYYLTASGSTAVDSKFPADSDKKTSRARGGRRSRKGPRKRTRTK